MAPNVGPTRARAIKFERWTADTVSGPADEVLPVPPQQGSMTSVAPRSSGLSNDQVGAVLAAKFDQVLSEMPHAHGWAGAAAHVMEDALADAVEAILREHQREPYTDENLVAGALRTAVKLRGKQHWWRRRERKSGQDHVELTADTAGLPTVHDDHDAAVDALSAQALIPFARDCLAELTETQAQIIRLQADEVGVRTIARQLGLERKDVQREIRYAEKAIAQFAMVLEAGRVCGKRAPAIAAYADGIASPDDVRRAEAHLDVCAACSAAFEQTKAALGAQVAALVPVPTVALAVTEAHGTGGGGLFARLSDLIGLGGGGGGRMEAMRETALGVFLRNPASAETVTGAGIGGAGLAVGAKFAAGACLAVVAGGGTAVCSSLGLLPEGLNLRQPAQERTAKREHADKPPVDKPAATTSTTPLVLASPVAPTTPTAPAPATRSNSSQAAKAASTTRRKARRARAARQRAATAAASSTNPLQSSAPTGAPSAPSPAAPPATPPMTATAAPEPPTSTGTASPALTGSGGGFENGTP